MWHWSNILLPCYFHSAHVLCPSKTVLRHSTCSPANDPKVESAILNMSYWAFHVVTLSISEQHVWQSSNRALGYPNSLNSYTTMGNCLDALGKWCRQQTYYLVVQMASKSKSCIIFIWCLWATWFHHSQKRLSLPCSPGHLLLMVRNVSEQF